MLSTLYWLIVFPFIVAFILGFLTYGLNQADNPSQTTPPNNPPQAVPGSNPTEA